MATELGSAYVQIIPSAKGISGNIAGLLSGEAGEAGEGAGSTFSSAFGKTVSGAISTLGLAKVGKEVFQTAADYNFYSGYNFATYFFARRNFSRHADIFKTSCSRKKF